MQPRKSEQGPEDVQRSLADLAVCDRTTFYVGKARSAQVFGVFRIARLEQRAPISFESLLYVLVYSLCLVMPFGLSHVDFKNREAVMYSIHAAPVVGVVCLSAFYLALLHLLRHMQDPFGRHVFRNSPWP